MNGRIIKTLILKDLRLFFSNQFFALVTVLALLGYATVYFFMPSTVNETVEMAIFAPNLPEQFAASLADDGVILKTMDSKADLQTAVLENKYPVGVVLPNDLGQKLAAGEQGQIELYFSPDFPQDLQKAYVIFFEEIGYGLSGQALSIEANEEILGVDRAGNQIPQRDKMLPLFALFILIMETLGLASLISAEIQTGTLQALLITPMKVEGLFIAKGIVGVGLAFVQAMLLMAVTGGLSQQPLLITVALLLGSLMVTGLGFLLASISTDIMSVMAWGIPIILILGLPAIGLLLPGVTSEWVRLIPSHYLVETVYQALNFNVGWSDAWSNMLILLAISLFFMGAGVMVLRRKFQ